MHVKASASDYNAVPGLAISPLDSCTTIYRHVSRYPTVLIKKVYSGFHCDVVDIFLNISSQVARKNV